MRTQSNIIPAHNMDAESALAAGRRKLGLLEKLQRRVIKNLANDAKQLSALSDMNTKFDALNERPLPTVVLIICASDVDRTTLLLTCSHHNVIPFCFSSHKAARKFLAKEQPWIRSDRKFPLLAYAPRQVHECICAVMCVSCSRSHLVRLRAVFVGVEWAEFTVGNICLPQAQCLVVQ